MSTTDYTPSAEMAASPGEGGLVTLTEDDWPDRGDWPIDPNTAAYADDYEPLAETDNAWNTRQREDDKRLNYGLGVLQNEIDALEDELGDLEDAFYAHNHDNRYYLRSETYSTGQAADRFVNESGDTMSGTLDMDSNEIHQLPDPGGPAQPVPKEWGDDRWVNETGDTMTGPLTIEDAQLLVNDTEYHPSGVLWYDDDEPRLNIGLEQAPVRARGNILLPETRIGLGTDDPDRPIHMAYRTKSGDKVHQPQIIFEDLDNDRYWKVGEDVSEAPGVGESFSIYERTVDGGMTVDAQAKTVKIFGGFDLTVNGEKIN